MGRFLKQIARIAPGVALMLAMGAPPVRAGESVPLKGNVQGEAGIIMSNGLPPATHCIGIGNASLLGRFTVEADHIYFTPMTFKGAMTLTAANGDTLTASYEGESLFDLGDTGSLPPSRVADTIRATITGGTGRFARATGSFTLETDTDDIVTINFPEPFQLAGVFEGRLSGTISVGQR